MGTLNLQGTLNLMGPLDLDDKLTIANIEALVVADDIGVAPPVLLPPPPGSPDTGTGVSIVQSFNRNVKTGSKVIVALGMVTQKNSSWPGMMKPSSGNTGAVTINHIAINVVGDQAIIFPSGGSATFTSSGQ